MPSVQASLFPFISSPTVVAHLERELRRVTKLAPDLSDLGCDRLLRGISLLAQDVDTEEFYIRQQIQQAARRVGILI